jgi:hypothetical protein
LSIVLSTGLIASKSKSIALKDIKNTNLKYNLVQAGLYFNSKGKLVKKTEVASGLDLDGDGKIGDVELSDEEKEVKPTISSAIEELVTISRVEVNNDKEVNIKSKDAPIVAVVSEEVVVTPSKEIIPPKPEETPEEIRKRLKREQMNKFLKR